MPAPRFASHQLLFQSRDDSPFDVFVCVCASIIVSLWIYDFITTTLSCARVVSWNSFQFIIIYILSVAVDVVAVALHMWWTMKMMVSFSMPQRQRQWEEMKRKAQYLRLNNKSSDRLNRIFVVLISFDEIFYFNFSWRIVWWYVSIVFLHADYWKTTKVLIRNYSFMQHHW